MYMYVIHVYSKTTVLPVPPAKLVCGVATVQILNASGASCQTGENRKMDERRSLIQRSDERKALVQTTKVCSSHRPGDHSDLCSSCGRIGGDSERGTHQGQVEVRVSRF